MSFVQIAKRVAKIGRDVARDAVEHNSEAVQEVAKRIEEVAKKELPKINQELKNAKVIGEMAVKFGKQRITKYLDEFESDPDKQRDK